ncbi:polysaccharide biosynthesis tyrosine autokinase [Subsaxibacter sp. CAU 1640]|uniref:GumC family protein n=1 Tax=Subsaxibacter sp. CAU 1640 TaxID=2933271 RepID=UPI002004C09A|nr:tyrosine-protein kinase domain-containing protein [Subsaxibacter sp. CAU 1640]MCK7590216.1 polysaccharide biosynthesis tyrosine autokinase [Subsaxibacter sp. CAU 1640]
MRQEEINALKSNKSDQGEVIKQEFYKYLRYWIWFAIGISFAFLIAFLYLRYTPRIYNSSAKIQILNKQKGLELPSSAFVFNRSNINLENEVEILRSYRIIEQVVRNLNLTMEFYEEGSVRTTEIDRFPFEVKKNVENENIQTSQTFRIEVKKEAFEIFSNGSDQPTVIPNFNSYLIRHKLPFDLRTENGSNIKDIVGKTFILRFLPLTSATTKLKNKITIGLVGKASDLLQISHSSESRPKSERILNELVEVFNMDGIIDRQEVSKRTIDFIDERFVYLAQELDSIETEKKDFKQSNDIIYIESNAAEGLGQRAQSDQNVFNIENQILLSKMLKETLALDKNKESDLLPSNIGIDNSIVNSLVDQYNTLVFERDKLMISGGESNPKVQVVNSKLNEVKDNIRVSLSAYEQQLDASKKQLLGRNQRFVSEVAQLPRKEKLLNSIERQRVIKETLYLFLLQKREEAAINLAITEPSIKVVEYALSGSAPISPNSRSVYLFALIAGLLIPFGVLYATIVLDTKIKSKNDIEVKVPNVPVLAELPRIKDKDLVFRDPTDRNVQAEAFRILSSNVNYILSMNAPSDGKVIYCTSTIKGEGKTYVGLNLSLALASLNKKVLLVGADLRNPQIHNYTDHNKDEAGLSNYLHDASFDWKKALFKGFEKYPEHYTLLSGSIPPNPTQLLTNGRFEKLLSEAKENFDYIVVDTAPTILVTDTMLISQWADATLYLVRAEFTEKNLLDFSKNLHETGRLKNMAYVINGVGASKSYGYTYNYGYSYGYGANMKIRKR